MDAHTIWLLFNNEPNIYSLCVFQFDNRSDVHTKEYNVKMSWSKIHRKEQRNVRAVYHSYTYQMMCNLLICVYYIHILLVFDFIVAIKKKDEKRYGEQVLHFMYLFILLYLYKDRFISFLFCFCLYNRKLYFRNYGFK